MNFPAPEIDEYLREITPDSPEILAEVEALAAERDFPIIGPLVGRVLFQIVKISGAKNVFELGSGFGYSALWTRTGVVSHDGGSAIHVCQDRDG